MISVVPKEEDGFYFNPRCHAIDDQTIAIGQKFHFSNKAKANVIPPELHSVLNHAGQHMHFDIDLGTSVEEIMASNDSLLKLLNQGFRVQKSLCLISNFKRVLMEFSKTDDEAIQIMAMTALMIAPITMLQFNANLNIEFDDFSEIEEHPMAQPFLATFGQLFEGQAGMPWNEFMDLKFDTEGCKVEPGSEEEIGLKFVELHTLLCSVVSDMNAQGNVELSMSIPSYLMTSEVHITAPGVQQAFALGLQMLIP